MAKFEHLQIVRDDALLWVRIDRPHAHNALCRAALAEIGNVFAMHAGDPSLKAAVLTGAGDKAFAAGGDLKEFSLLRSAQEAAALFDSACAALERVRRFPVPVIAALNGLAVGGGAELAMACDFRLAAANASIGYIHGRLGISSGFGGGTDLIAFLGTSRALLHMLRTENLAPAQARDLGIVNEIASEGESLEDCVRRFAAPILRLPVQVIRSYKAVAIAAREGRPREELLRLEREGFAATWVHPDHWSAADRLLRRDDSEAKR